MITMGRMTVIMEAHQEEAAGAAAVTGPGAAAAVGTAAICHGVAAAAGAAEISPGAAAAAGTAGICPGAAIAAGMTAHGIGEAVDPIEAIDRLILVAIPIEAVMAIPIEAVMAIPIEVEVMVTPMTAVVITIPTALAGMVIIMPLQPLQWTLLPLNRHLSVRKLLHSKHYLCS